MYIYVYLFLLTLLSAQKSLVQNDYRPDPDRLFGRSTSRVVVEGKIPVRFFEISNTEDLSTGVNIPGLNDIFPSAHQILLLIILQALVLANLNMLLKK
jgi:hypothetical protein